MESLIKSTRDQNFSALITVVISDNELAPGIGLAKNYNVPVEIFDKKNSTDFSLRPMLKEYY